MLEISGLSAAGLLAGCPGGDADTPGGDGGDGGSDTTSSGGDGGDGGDGETDTTSTDDDSGNPFLEGHELRMPTDIDPLTTTFLVFGDWNSYHDSRFEPAQAGGMKDPSVWGLWRLHEFQNELGRDGEGRLFESWDFNNDHEASADNPQYIEVTLREDAKWSDGEPITAWDLYVNAGIKRLRVSTNADDQESFHAAPGGADMRNNFDYMEMPDGRDGKTLRFVSEGLGMGLGDTTVSGFLGYWNGGRMSIDTPAHHEDIAPMADAIKASLDAALENPTDLDAWQTREEIIQEHVTDEMLQRWRDPDNVVTSGPWQLEEVRGSQEIRLSKNPHFRKAEQVNFSRVTVEYMPSDARRNAAIQSGLLDWGQVSLTQASVDALPDKYEQENSVGAGPGVIHLNHAHFAFQHLEVRQAISYAIDQQAVADNVNPAATDPIDYPGAEVSNADFVWDRDEVESTFINYAQDQDKADSLMQSAGFSRNGNGVWEKDGQALSFNFHTATQDPVYETTVASQLSRWGADVQVQVIQEAELEDRRNNGELDFYASGGGLNHHIGDIDSYWGVGLLLNRDYIDRHNIYDRQKMEEAVSHYPESGWVYDNWTHWDDLTIDLPPVGEPDGATEPVAVSYIGGQTLLGTESMEEVTGPRGESYWDLMAWATNYYVPAIPLYQELEQHFINSKNFDWPIDHPMWSQFGFQATTDDFLSTALVQGDIDNPKDGATVTNE